MLIKFLFDAALVLGLIAAYIYNDRTGAITEFERKVWNSFCGTINSWIRKYERKKRRAEHGI